MTFGCRHNFEYSRGQFSCSKCGMNAKENQFKRNHNKSYAIIVIIGLVIISGIYVYGNYHNVIMGSIPAINNERDAFKGIDELVKIPDNISKTISDKISEKIEPKQANIESKLEDCSKYRKDVRDEADAYLAIQKTKECEQYNKQIEMQQASQGIVTSEPVSNVILHRGVVGTFSIEKIIVSEKEYYRTISLNLNVKAENLHLDDEVLFSPLAITLKNEKGTLYLSQPQECSSPMAYHITGKTGPNLSITVCYDVEKEFKRFDVFFGQKIGSFTLN